MFSAYVTPHVSGDVRTGCFERPRERASTAALALDRLEVILAERSLRHLSRGVVRQYRVEQTT
jgi:septum formation topological specificity factor MinE